MNHEPPTRPSAYKWWVVVMLWFVCFFNYADRQAIFSVFPLLRSEFGFDKLELGLIGSAFMWVYAGLSPVAGFVGDRYRRKDLILGGCLFWSGVTMVTSGASRLWHFVSVRALEGLGESFYFPASMSMLGDYHSSKTRSRAMSFHQSSVYIGTIAGGWLGGMLAEKIGWRFGFFVFGITGMLLALVLYRFLNEPVRGSDNRDLTMPAPNAKEPLDIALGKLLRRSAAMVLMFVFFGANYVAVSFLTWAPTLMTEKFHFKLGTAGLTGTVFIHLASACSVPFGGWWADRLSRTNAGGRTLVQAIGLLAGASFVYLIGATNSLSVLLVSMVAFGICKGLYDANIFASVYDLVHPSIRALTAGSMNMIGWLGGALAPVVVGWIAKTGSPTGELERFSNALAFGGVIYLVCGIVLAVTAFNLTKAKPAMVVGS